MNNTQKDRYEKKLLRFLKDCDKLDAKICDEQGYLTVDRWSALFEQLKKRYGFSETDCERAWAIHRHSSDRHYWHDIRFHKGEEKQKKLDKAERKLKPSDNALEAELKAEDDFIMDVYDEYYDPEKDMSR